MSYFSPKPERDMKIVNPSDTKPAERAPTVNPVPEMVSTLGHGMLITGNIVCAGPVQIFGCVNGDIHASQLTIAEGARVVGNIIAPDTTVQGAFSGTIRGNTVKLQGTAVVEGEIFNKTLTIEQSAQFEGVARRLEQPVSPPSSAQIKGEEPAPASSPPAAPEFRNGRLGPMSELRN